ncbi:MAG: haloacid dehalogenase type II [Candidatus Limnocylindrales bacterium]|nr:haloacid dehalogenase type II [Candidatus Limnocylindrales bacterium]
MTELGEPRRVGVVCFDLYGTLVDLAPLDVACEALAPRRGGPLAARWRARQLEASWLRTAMDRWADFELVTREALDVACAEFGVDPDPEAREATRRAFLELPPLAGAVEGVADLGRAGLRLAVLSNGSAAMIEASVRSAGLDGWFEALLSADAARAYKPHPAVYQLAVDRFGWAPERIGFVTANGWDAAGAAAHGFAVAWLRPPGAVLPAVPASIAGEASWATVPRQFAPG